MKKLIALLTVVTFILALTACGKKTDETGIPTVAPETSVATSETDKPVDETTAAPTDVTETTEAPSGTVIDPTGETSAVSNIGNIAFEALNLPTGGFPITKEDYQDAYIKSLVGYTTDIDGYRINYWIIEFDTTVEGCPTPAVGEKFTLTNTSGVVDDGYTVTAINGNYVLALNEIDNTNWQVNWAAPYATANAQAVYDAFINYKE